MRRECLAAGPVPASHPLDGCSPTRGFAGSQPLHERPIDRESSSSNRIRKRRPPSIRFCGMDAIARRFRSSGRLLTIGLLVTLLVFVTSVASHPAGGRADVTTGSMSRWTQPGAIHAEGSNAISEIVGDGNSGQPLGGICIVFYSTVGPPTWSGSTQSGPDGTFSFTPAVAENYDLAVFGPTTPGNCDSMPLASNPVPMWFQNVALTPADPTTSPCGPECPTFRPRRPGSRCVWAPPALHGWWLPNPAHWNGFDLGHGGDGRRPTSPERVCVRAGAGTLQCLRACAHGIRRQLRGTGPAVQPQLRRRLRSPVRRWTGTLSVEWATAGAAGRKATARLLEQRLVRSERLCRTNRSVHHRAPVLANGGAGQRDGDRRLPDDRTRRCCASPRLRRRPHTSVHGIAHALRPAVPTIANRRQLVDIFTGLTPARQRRRGSPRARVSGHLGGSTNSRVHRPRVKRDYEPRDRRHRGSRVSCTFVG